MAEIKTKMTKTSVTDFLAKIPDAEKRKDALVLLKLFKKITGEKPRMWGSSIVGFGTFHYKSKSSEGDWFMTGFSPRKQNLTLYVLEWQGDDSNLLKKLGKHKRGGGCLYINKLADVDEKILAKLIKRSYERKKK
jgi:nucleoid DNA-binding protein